LPQARRTAIVLAFDAPVLTLVTEEMRTMLTAKVGFIVYGVHKDGLEDPMGTPFIDDALVASAKSTLREAGLEVVEWDTVLATKAEAQECLGHFKKQDDIDAVVLFSGTWVWAAHMIAAMRDFAGSGKGILLWTNPGSQGWRPVGGLVMHGACKEIGLSHRFVYGAWDDPAEVRKITSYCRGAALRNRLNMSTIGAFGGRGMGQTCGVADPSQWMKVFGVDIDSRDTALLVETAKSFTAYEVANARAEIQPYFEVAVPADPTAERSIRLYLALKKLIADEGFDFYTIQSFPGLGDEYAATCFAQSMMLQAGVGTSTLSDFNTAMTVKLLTDLSTEPVYYGDLQHIDKARQEIKIIGDGACPPSLAGEIGPAIFAEHGIPTEGEAGGLSVDLVCHPGEGVLARLGRVDGEFEMVLVRCTVKEPSPDEIQKRREECQIPFWPHAFCTADGDMDALLEAWNNEYAVLGYGESLYDDLVAFCEQAGIRCIAL
jgi:L-fucose isomerase-like protein